MPPITLTRPPKQPGGHPLPSRERDEDLEHNRATVRETGVTRPFAHAALLLALAALAAGCGGDDQDAARIRHYRDARDTVALAAEVEKPAPAVARMAVEALGHCGPPAAAPLEKAARDTRPEVREMAAIALVRVAGDRPPPVLAALARSDTSADVRAAAVTALGQVRAVDEMETLLAALEDPDRAVRLRASVAVARIIGRRYETHVDGSPDKQREAVAQLRKAWPEMEGGVRDYLKSRPAAAKR